jgi:hypothetical protein
MAMSRFDGCKPLTDCPSMRISPALTDSNPAMVFSKVDLPQPEGPTSTRNPPLSSVRLMFFSTSTVPKALAEAL